MGTYLWWWGAAADTSGERTTRTSRNLNLLLKSQSNKVEMTGGEAGQRPFFQYVLFNEEHQQKEKKKKKKTWLSSTARRNCLCYNVCSSSIPKMSYVELNMLHIEHVNRETKWKNANFHCILVNNNKKWTAIFFFFSTCGSLSKPKLWQSNETLHWESTQYFQSASNLWAIWDAIHEGIHNPVKAL